MFYGNLNALKACLVIIFCEDSWLRSSLCIKHALRDDSVADEVHHNSKVVVVSL